MQTREKQCIERGALIDGARSVRRTGFVSHVVLRAALTRHMTHVHLLAVNLRLNAQVRNSFVNIDTLSEESAQIMYYE